MRKLLPMVLFAAAALADEPIMLGTKDHKVTSPLTIDFSTATVLGLPTGTGTVTSITASAPIIVTPSPIITTGAISLNATSKANWDTAYTDRLKWDGCATGLDPATGRTSLGLGTAALADASSFEGQLTFDMSIVQSSEGGIVKLAGDATSPGNSQYYGTNASGTKGWFALPASGSVSDTAFGGSWNGVTTTAPSQNSLYDYLHQFDTDDDGRVNILDVAGPAIVSVNAGGGAFAATPGIDYEAALGNPSTNGFVLSSTTAGVRSWVASGGNVSNSGTPTANQLPIWVSATAIKGVTGVAGGTAGQVLKKNSATDYDWAWAADSGGGGGTPGGASGDVQWNNGGAFDGGSNVKRDVNNLWIGGGSSVGGNPLTVNTSALGTGFAVVAGSGSGNSPQFSLYEGATQRVAMGLALAVGHYSTLALANDGIVRSMTGNLILSTENFGTGKISFTNISSIRQMELLNSGVLAFSSSSSLGDTGIGRNAAGILEINNGTAGQYRDLYARNITLQSSGVITGSGTVPTGGSAGQVLKKNTATNYDYSWASDAQYNSYAAGLTGQSIGASDTYLTGSLISFAAGDLAVGSCYHAVVHISKGASGTAALNLIVRAGTNGSLTDTALVTFAPTAGTAAADTGTIEVWVRLVTISASATGNHNATYTHNLTSTGLWNVGTQLLVAALGNIATFNATTATKFGMSYKGDTGNHVVNVLRAELTKP